MGYLYDAQQFLTTPSQKRTYCFIGTAVAFVIIILIIIIAAASSSSDSSSDEKSTPTTPWEIYLATKKYLYVWGYPNTENFLKFVKDHKFSRVYLYVGCVEWDYSDLVQGNFHDAGQTDANKLIQSLLDMGVEVEPTMYLYDNQDDFSDVDKVEDVAKAMANLQKTLKFKALHFDIEPDKKVNYEALLKMYETARKYLKVSAILKPAWLDQDMASLESVFTSADYYKKFKDCKTLVDAFMMVTDYSDLMAYRNTYEKTNILLDKYDVIRKRHTDHEAKPVIELNPDVTDAGIYAKYKEDHDTFFKYVNEVSQKFDGITIHQYQAWAKDLYCVEQKKDTEYYFGEPKKC